MFKYVAVSLLIASALAVPAPENTNLDCMEHQDDIFSCLAVKAVTTLDRAARSSDINIIEGVTFVRETPLERSGKSLKSETEVLEELPRAAADRTLELATMMYESAVSFFKSHSLKVNMPDARSLEGRKSSLKKLALPLIAAAGLKIFALLPIFLGGVALAIVKAVVVGKIALLIAGILAFQRLFSGSSVGPVSPFGGIGGNFFGKNPAPYYNDGQAWSSSQASQPQGYYRSFSESNADAQKLAYSAQAPSSNEAH